MSVGPRLTIGLPVYNGQNFLSESLDALLAQTYTDYELVISDNHSADDTEAICREYAARDERIRYIRQPHNIGAAPNHGFLVREARGELFKWASHDDLYAPKLLTRCIETLDEHRELVLCHADMAFVDTEGKIIENYDYCLATNSPRAPERFRSLLFTDGGDDFYGVIRTDVVRRIPPENSYHNSGRKLVAELSLYGPFYQVPELLYFRRDHPGRGDRSGSVQAVCAHLDPRRKGQSSVRLVGEYALSYLPAIRRAPLSATDRRLCYQYYLEWLASRTILKPFRKAE
jgi:glycosyltransferase involved in cell wall biosynthesis